MVTKIWQWMVYKELVFLGRMHDFNHVQPERVIRVLHSFARSRLMSAKIPSPEDSLRSIEFREALLSIWELSRNRYHHDAAKRAKWHLVMASCNSLYEQFSKKQTFHVPQAQAA